MRAVSLDLATKPSPTVKAYGAVSWFDDEGDRKSMARVITELENKVSLSGEVVAASSDLSTMVRYEHNSPLPPDRLNKLLRLELTQHMAGLEGDLAADVVAVPIDGDDLIHCCAMAQPLQVKEFLRELSDSKISVQSLNHPAAALANSLRLADRSYEEEQQISLVIDIGARNTRCVLMRGGDFLSCRQLTFGGENFTEVLAQGRRIPREEAERLKCGESASEPVAPSAAPPEAIKSSDELDAANNDLIVDFVKDEDLRTPGASTQSIHREFVTPVDSAQGGEQTASAQHDSDDDLIDFDLDDDDGAGAGAGAGAPVNKPKPIVPPVQLEDSVQAPANKQPDQLEVTLDQADAAPVSDAPAAGSDSGELFAGMADEKSKIVNYTHGSDLIRLDDVVDDQENDDLSLDIGADAPAGDSTGDSSGDAVPALDGLSLAQAEAADDDLDLDLGTIADDGDDSLADESIDDLSLSSEEDEASFAHADVDAAITHASDDVPVSADETEPEPQPSQAVQEKAVQAPAPKMTSSLIDVPAPAKPGRQTMVVGGAELGPECQRVAEQLYGQVAKTLTWFKAQLRQPHLEIDQVIIMGGGAQLAGLAPYWSRRFQVPVHGHNPFAVLQGDKPVNEHGYELALALALSNAPGMVAMDLRPESMIRQDYFQQKVLWPRVGAAVLAAAGLCFGIGIYQAKDAEAENLARYKAFEQRRASLNSQFKQLKEQNAGQRQDMREIASRIFGGRDLLYTIRALKENAPDELWITDLATEGMRDGGNGDALGSFGFGGGFNGFQPQPTREKSNTLDRGALFVRGQVRVAEGRSVSEFAGEMIKWRQNVLHWQAADQDKSLFQAEELVSQEKSEDGEGFYFEVKFNYQQTSLGDVADEQLGEDTP